MILKVTIVRFSFKIVGLLGHPFKFLGSNPSTFQVHDVLIAASVTGKTCEISP